MVILRNGDVIVDLAPQIRVKAIRGYHRIRRSFQTMLPNWGENTRGQSST